MKAFVRAALATTAMLAAVPALAQSTDAPDLDKDSLTIAVGGAYIPSYEGSDDYIFTPGAQLRGKVSGFKFFTRGTQLLVDAIPDSSSNNIDFQLGPVASVRLDRTRRIKDPRVNALGELDTAFELGGFVGISKTGVFTSPYDTISARVSYVADVGDAHKSYVITPSIEYGTPLSRRAYVGISASADYVGKGYANYYYNISVPSSIASTLPAYGGADDAGFKKVGANLMFAHSITGDLTGGLSLVAVGGYSRILGDFARSPIVSDAGSRDQWVGALGLAYTF